MIPVRTESISDFASDAGISVLERTFGPFDDILCRIDVCLIEDRRIRGEIERRKSSIRMTSCVGRMITCGSLLDPRDNERD